MITPTVTHPVILALFADDVSHELPLFEFSEPLTRERHLRVLDMQVNYISICLYYSTYGILP